MEIKKEILDILLYEDIGKYLYVFLYACKRKINEIVCFERAKNFKSNK